MSFAGATITSIVKGLSSFSTPASMLSNPKKLANVIANIALLGRFVTTRDENREILDVTHIQAYGRSIAKAYMETSQGKNIQRSIKVNEQALQNFYKCLYFIKSTHDAMHIALCGMKDAINITVPNTDIMKGQIHDVRLGCPVITSLWTILYEKLVRKIPADKAPSRMFISRGEARDYSSQAKIGRVSINMAMPLYRKNITTVILLAKAAKVEKALEDLLSVEERKFYESIQNVAGGYSNNKKQPLIASDKWQHIIKEMRGVVEAIRANKKYQNTDAIEAACLGINNLVRTIRIPESLRFAIMIFARKIAWGNEHKDNYYSDFRAGILKSNKTFKKIRFDLYEILPKSEAIFVALYTGNDKESRTIAKYGKYTSANKRRLFLGVKSNKVHITEAAKENILTDACDKRSKTAKKSQTFCNKMRFVRVSYPKKKKVVMRAWM